MSIYLPIAEMNINIFLIVFIGMVVGALSGLFGVGGGFLMTPLLIFLGIPVSPKIIILVLGIRDTSQNTQVMKMRGFRVPP